MTTTLPRVRVDERAMGAGTTLRFVLLVALMLVSCGYVMGGVSRAVSHRSGFGYFGCLLASGGDPFQGSLLDNLITAVGQDKAYEGCTARYEPSLPWWVTLAWPVLLLAVAGALFWALPVWKARRGRVVPLAAVDNDGEILRVLKEFAAVAGLARVPRVVVDPAAASTGAVVFGSNRRPTVCLHGGLLARRHTDPDGFRAVLLHELAHIRNGDVTLTYVTVAAWRAFVAVALVPSVVFRIRGAVTLSPMYRPAEVPALTRFFALMLFMVVLVYLARSDVLRNREIYADRAAVRWGADPRGWVVPAGGPPRGVARRALAAFVELWRTHPRWDLRRDSLADPVALFGVRALPLFLTGSAATLIYYQLAGTTQQWDGRWADYVRASASAALITGVVGVAVWRGVVHAVLTSRRVPSGVRAGLWLGAGMAAGELVVNDVAVFRWLPARPEFLALAVLAGVVIVWWTAQCAHLWVRVWRGRTIHPAMLLGLVTMCLALSSWFVWWKGSGSSFAMGQPFNPATLYEASGLASVPAPYRSTPAGIMVNLQRLADRPLALPAVAALCVVPLLAWLVRPDTATPAWARDALRGSEDAGMAREALPPLRRVLLAAVLGGAAGWAAFAGAAAHLHTRQPAAGQLTRLYVVNYFGWVLAAFSVGAAVAALLASVRARRYRLLIALVAAESAAAVAFAGMFVLASFDGCVQPLNVLVRSCDWRPASSWEVLHYLLGPALLLAAATAVVAAAGVSAIRRVRRPAMTPGTAARPAGREGNRPAAQRLWASVWCAAAVVVTVTAVLPDTHGAPGQGVIARTRPTASAPDRPPMTAPTSARTRGVQVLAWHSYGGGELINRFLDSSKSFTELLVKGNGRIDESRVRPYCTAFGRIARDAEEFFRVPDPQAQSHWQKFVTRLESAGRTCEQATRQSNGDLLMVSVKDLVQATAAADSASARMDTVRREGDL
ncbi:M48 family metallopeptidase [Streptomyces sp. ISL-11]|uniref:M48 family metallopeptidase n=1 Tax=Streptomyces sp. ISL-11 TaxID=2819174 RepID=UPI001BEA2F33|nr:M48 family metalloprotease [Streptomyces sp. ISL-11]MBT2383087.1 M48 family metalloprotease [Streptomyces sp. ISL-11]